MTVSLVVAAPHAGSERRRHWAWLRARYLQAFPGWQLVEHTTPVTPWSKGAAINAAAKRATGDVLVLADADMLVDAAALHEALAALRGGAAWVMPYDRVFRLSRTITAALVNDRARAAPRHLPGRDLQRPVTRGPAGGGIVVLPAQAFRAVGGIDPRFEIWGGEDISFARALDTLAGPHARLTHSAWHLFHPTLRPRNGRASTVNEQLAGRYLDAAGDPAAMTRLCTR